MTDLVADRLEKLKSAVLLRGSHKARTKTLQDWGANLAALDPIVATILPRIRSSFRRCGTILMRSSRSSLGASLR